MNQLVRWKPCQAAASEWRRGDSKTSAFCRNSRGPELQGWIQSPNSTYSYFVHFCPTTSYQQLHLDHISPIQKWWAMVCFFLSWIFWVNLCPIGKLTAEPVEFEQIWSINRGRAELEQFILERIHLLPLVFHISFVFHTSSSTCWRKMPSWFYCFYCFAHV